MRQYEMTYLVSDKVSDADMNAATGRINAMITDHKGKILGEENWGRRKLAYPIDKQDFATYITLNFELMPSELSAINRELRLSKDIVRSLIILKEFTKEKLTLTAEEVAENEAIEEVVGGERSFEAVEGETEESYGLMAKREDADEKTDEAEVEVNAAETKAEEMESEKVDSESQTEQTEEAAATDEKPAVEKKAKKTTKKAKDEEKQPAPSKDKKSAKKESDAEAEADRLAKLDEEIEGILGDDL